MTPIKIQLLVLYIMLEQYCLDKKKNCQMVIITDRNQ